MSAFSDRLVRLKLERGVRQKDLATALDIPLRTYQRYEYGEIEPQLSALVRLADFYGVSLDELTGRAGPFRPLPPNNQEGR